MSLVSDNIRKAFGEGDAVRDAGLTTPEDIIRYDDILYGTDPHWQVMDVYRPRQEEGKRLPVIVSIHGGGWVYGDKERYQYYCMDLAQRGFVVVNFTYRLAPEFKFPSSMEDTNLVFGWVMEHAQEYGMDVKNVFAVGDSAGAHQLGLYAAMLTNPGYAALYPFTLPKKLCLNAIALNCGMGEVRLTGDSNDMTQALMGDYLPEKGTEEELHRISMVNYVTEDYPPTYIMTAVDDFLRMQAPVMASTLIEKGVPFVLKFYGDKENRLGHVFHLNIRSQDAIVCNDEECRFFQTYRKEM